MSLQWCQIRASSYPTGSSNVYRWSADHRWIPRSSLPVMITFLMTHPIYIYIHILYIYIYIYIYRYSLTRGSAVFLVRPPCFYRLCKQKTRQVCSNFKLINEGKYSTNFVWKTINVNGRKMCVKSSVSWLICQSFMRPKQWNNGGRTTSTSRSDGTLQPCLV